MNKMPTKARSARKLESDLINAVYVIHGGLLYRYMRNSTGESDPVLCVPASKIDTFLELFHSSIFGRTLGNVQVCPHFTTKILLSLFSLPCKNIYYKLSCLSDIQKSQAI